MFASALQNPLGWAPTTNYVDLVNPGHANYITAPANGYMFLLGTPTGNAAYLALLLTINSGADALLGSCETATNRAGQSFWCNIPVKKGQEIQVAYAGTTIDVFRFCYAEGEL